MSIGLLIMRLKCCQCQITAILFPEIFSTQPRDCQELNRKKCCIKTGTTKTAMPPPMQCFSSCVDPWIQTVYVTAGLGNIYPVVWAINQITTTPPEAGQELHSFICFACKPFQIKLLIDIVVARLLSCLHLFFFAVFCSTQMTNLGLAKMRLKSFMHQKHVFW